MGDYDLLIDAGGERRFYWPNWRKIRFSKKQLDYICTDARLEIGMAGRGFGKDHLALWKKTIRGDNKYWARREGRDPKFRRPGLKWHLGVFAGESDNYEDNINKLHSILPHLPGKGIGGKPNFHWNSTDQRFELYGERQYWISMYSLYGKGQKRGPGFDDVLVTEAQGVSKDKVMSVVMPMIVRGGYTVNITLIGTGNCGWFDDAFIEAQSGDPEAYFGNWTWFDGTSFDNPELDEETAAQMLREYSENPSRFQIERLGLPNIILQPDEKPDLPFSQALVDCSLTHDRLTLDGPPVLILDLMYGGTDKICLGVWNKLKSALLWCEFYTSDPAVAAREGIDLLQIDTANPHPTLAKFFMDLSQRFPGAPIAFDAQGRYGGTLHSHIPPHIKIIPMRRSRPEKNTMVENVIERMGLVDQNGRSLGMVLPHPESKWLTAKQRVAMRKLITDTVNYRRVTVTTPRGDTAYYYTKGIGFEDDGPDMLSWATSQLPPMNRRRPDPLKDGRAVKRSLFFR